MTWSYRLIRTPDNSSESGFIYHIHEVHYNKSGEPMLHTEKPSRVCGDTKEETRTSHSMMAQAFEQPVLEYNAKLKAYKKVD